MSTPSIPASGFAAWLWDLRFAAGLLTRAPLGVAEIAPPERAARAAWAYPVIGAAVGVVAAGIFSVALALSGAPFLAATLVYAAGLMMTGALHEDGLADLCDAAGVRGGPDAARAAMKQPMVGAFAVVGLIADAGLRVAALATLAAAAPAALIAAAAFSRAAAVAALAWRPPATDGLAAGVGRPPMKVAGVALGIAAAIAALCAVWAPPAMACALGLGAGAWAARWGARILGGVTGDVAGGCVRATETGGLALAALMMGAVG